MKRSRLYAMVLVAMVVLLVAVVAVPALAASTGRSAQGVSISDRPVKVALAENCPMPARMLVDGNYIYVCPPVKKLLLPRP